MSWILLKVSLLYSHILPWYYSINWLLIINHLLQPWNLPPKDKNHWRESEEHYTSSVIPIIMATIKKKNKITCNGKDVKKGEPCALVVETATENSKELPWQIKNRITIWPSNSTSRFTPKGSETETQRNIYQPMFIAALFKVAQK